MTLNFNFRTDFVVGTHIDTHTDTHTHTCTAICCEDLEWAPNYEDHRLPLVKTTGVFSGKRYRN